jgi:hypothetical protein
VLTEQRLPGATKHEAVGSWTVRESPRLTPDQVISVYVEVLGREPTAEEISDQLAVLPDLNSMLRIALDSEEYAVRLAEADVKRTRTPTVVNIYHPDLKAFGPTPGTRSPDGNVVVGRDGQLFLSGGSNAVLDQYTGEVQLAPDWLHAWGRLIRSRRAEMDTMGIASVLLIVPDKLAVYEDLYPELIGRRGPRPAERLQGIPELKIFYPLEELRAAASCEDIYPRTDTHLTFRGNELLAASLLGLLGIELPDFSGLPMHSYAITGDLGSKFNPPVVSIISEPGTLGTTEIIADNSAEIQAVGGHIGTHRVFRNEASPDPRVVVLFGDSFGFSGTNYQSISWFIAQVFRETHFVWIPFGWDPDYVHRVGGEVVLMEGAERFVARVPHLRTDVSKISAETLRRKQPVGVEAVSHG